MNDPITEGWNPVYPLAKLPGGGYAGFRMPNVDESVIIAYFDYDYDSEGGSRLASVVGTGFWHFNELGEPSWTCSHGYEPLLVFAWMPLPDLPSWYVYAEGDE